MEKATGAPVPQTDDGRPFCLSYHLKGVCNSNCCGRHAHRTLYPHEQGVLSAWKSQFCTAPPPVTEIAPPPLGTRRELSGEYHALHQEPEISRLPRHKKQRH